MLHAFPHARTRKHAHVCTWPSSGPHWLSPDRPFLGVCVLRQGVSGCTEGRSSGGSWPCGPDGGGSVFHPSREWPAVVHQLVQEPPRCPELWSRRANHVPLVMKSTMTLLLAFPETCTPRGRGREGGPPKGLCVRARVPRDVPANAPGPWVNGSEWPVTGGASGVHAADSCMGVGSLASFGPAEER